ncbi:hypothetical protein [Congregibacter litoralis]|uniref:TonB-dependent receptor n=1 Tax=Congregibacter litoralis KT71 TaxID=314285 RepID=V7HV89_9GAMM|nr:hypothetical protein [Congregibacter litoralis]ESZ89447.1 hypothetical protein KT71_002555 [Congregibacter litoralis KT71]
MLNTQTHGFTPRLLALAVAASSVGLSTDTHAQERLVLEVVTVVAQKREESVFEVPAAVSAVSGEMLETLELRISEVLPLFRHR